MPKHEPFPPEAEARFARLASALRAYVDDAHLLAGSGDAYTAFRLRDDQTAIDAFVLVAPYDDGPCFQLISDIAQLCVQALILLDGDPVAAQYFGKPRR